PKHIALPGSQCHPDTNLMRALVHGVGDYAVNARGPKTKATKAKIPSTIRLKRCRTNDWETTCSRVWILDTGWSLSIAQISCCTAAARVNGSVAVRTTKVILRPATFIQRGCACMWGM